ncbi:acyltransferase [Azorhizobium oxalatiphilum]|uniref:Acyltransferase n=1 Tax=Azorhizobium oxalatiphilum TaxID=980631 RepID=A0A917BLN1_9HYPH|nr:acyltransferase [Azorhizobium oxalatiphilum]GGF47249.1 acyltransferase [Azorhizobium oxalatiphilum]
MTAQAPTPASRTDRVTCLDGLRGVAACAVVLFHFLYAFKPMVFANSRVGFSLSDTPLAILWNGRFSVAVFFVLSGFVLAASAPRSWREAPLLVGLRYLRLAIPALISSVIAWGWLMGFPDAVREAHALTGSWWFRWTYQPPIPPLSQAMWEGAVGVFLEGTTRFNNPLWTMKTELLGSLMIYIGYAVTPPRWRMLVLTAGAIALIMMDEIGLAAFCAGALIFEGRALLRPHAALGLGLGAVGLILGAPLSGHAAGPGVTDTILASLGTNGLREAGATLVVISILMTPALRSFFERPLLQKLGELSFPLYLVHVPLIVGPACAAYVALAPMGTPGLVLLFAAVAAASLALAVPFLWLVERPTLNGLKALRTRGRARLATL